MGIHRSNLSCSGSESLASHYQVAFLLLIYHWLKESAGAEGIGIECDALNSSQEGELFGRYIRADDRKAVIGLLASEYRREGWIVKSCGIPNAAAVRLHLRLVYTS